MAEEHVTFCRICEAHCGMVATVQDERVVELRPDRRHPLSRGYACPKGIAMLDVQNDPDRVLQPLRRRRDGRGFDPVSWESAMGDIAGRLRAILGRHGPASLAWYMGNPAAFSYSHTLWVTGLLKAIGTPHYYGAGSQDVNNRFAASALLYGSPVLLPVPDLRRTTFLLMIGANPLVSHGSVLTAPRVRDQLHDIVARGGRVVVVDPRRSETARAFEHVAVHPDSDAWLLLSLLHVVFADGLEDRDAIAAQARGVETLRAAVADFAPERTAERTGVAPETLRALAHDVAGADAAAGYGRTGSCLGRFGTLVAYLLDALAQVTGNMDRPGGLVFGRPAVAIEDVAERAGVATYGAERSRFGDFPDVLGALPATLLAREISTPGERQVRALFVSAGNPVLSVPDGDALESAMGQLDLCVSLDFYVNETNRHADYVLPTTTWLEREDLPLAFLGFYTTPFVQWTEAVVAPAGQARQEWEIVDDLARRIGVVPSPLRMLRLAGRLGVRFGPRRLVDLTLRTGPGGDLFGLRPRGLSVRRLRSHPHGVITAEHIATGVLADKLRHRDRRVALDAAPAYREIERLRAVEADAPDEGRPLRLIGLRELRSHNSWMHNAELLQRGGRVHALRMHPRDAAARALADGDVARVSSRRGAVEVPVKVTDEMIPGTVALPHGWGHRGGWARANANPGVNVNLLSSAEPEDLEPLAGMAFLNGIPVEVQRVGAPRAAPAPAPAAATAPPARS